MQCLNFLNLSIVNNSPLNLKGNTPLKCQPRTQLFCCSRYYHDDENGDNSVKAQPLLPIHVNTITSTSNPFVKHCVKLRESSSYRHSHGSVLLVGSTPIRELCSFEGKDEDRSAIIECLLVLDNTQVSEDLSDHYICRVTVSPAVMKKLSGLQSTDSIEMAALIRPSRFQKLGSSSREKDCHEWFPFHHRILVLDGIQDPGNLGTLLRSAIAFKWDGVYLLSECCDPFNYKALRTSCGASFQLPIVSGDWTHLDMMRKKFHMKILAGHLPRDGDAKSVFWLSKDYADSVVNTPICLVLGSEGSGLSEKSREECELVSIPMAGEFESLNVSVAGGIFLYLLQPQKS